MGNLIACGGKPVTGQTVIASGVYVYGNLQKQITFTFPEKIIGIESISLSNTNVKILGLSRVSANVINLWLNTISTGYTTDITVVANGY